MEHSEADWPLATLENVVIMGRYKGEPAGGAAFHWYVTPASLTHQLKACML